MISVAQALQTVLNSSHNYGVEEIPFLKSMGRILKEEIVADRDFPPFNRVCMDGIAIDYQQFKNGRRVFKIEGIQAAGSKQIRLKNTKNCIEVMTGAILPNHTNTVIRYEDVTLEDGIATVNIDLIKEGQNSHNKGKDRKVNDLLITQNTKISAAEMGVLATVGKSVVKVAKQPKVMIVSTGDELVGVDQIPLEYQIRRSNVFTLVSLLERLNITSETSHISDDKLIIKSKIESYLHEYDVVLFSGAVSKGKYDFLPEIFEELKVYKKFHKVMQRPGKPFYFGKTDTCTVFGFPGNPISTFVNCLAYFYPWYHRSVGLEIIQETAILGEDVSFVPNLDYFLQVALENKSGNLVAIPVAANGSGDLASLANTDAFIQLPKDTTEFKKGAVYPILKYR
ncbi:MAG: molybdopterin molybdotransferase MoeA [Polaribacter sp.]|jgi:molybdopterin molybdotransferase|nr:molybdopterin molybdotransferase MoeA [Polaribacter sp.]